MDDRHKESDKGQEHQHSPQERAWRVQLSMQCLGRKIARSGLRHTHPPPVGRARLANDRGMTNGQLVGTPDCPPSGYRVETGACGPFQQRQEAVCERTSCRRQCLRFRTWPDRP